MSSIEAQATARAAKFVACWAAEDPGYVRALHEARRDGQLLEFAIALAARCVQLADELYGDQRQPELDGYALDAGWLAEHG
ncbi:Uncharacterised protein [Mycobacteroides abscessus subsp. massiliense]|uniref:hypothetical protein n=1 Tax=Mycobacteroides abscessus TaxID=36809 RepID=UPI0009A739FC|nr:hypothetical protein [Mycobacteroides abscessus]SKY52367.1 Uncharacterised protein [Mycobacteroides abscessus subsp. massiliense]SKZ09238.1 Uncharacterised protein [Mycobacteroides abscessus subsp. massiliense]